MPHHTLIRHYSSTTVNDLSMMDTHDSWLYDPLIFSPYTYTKKLDYSRM